MRILICTARMGIGGAESHVLTLSAELVRAGHSVTVASSGGLLVPRLEAAGARHMLLPLDRKDPVSVAASLRGILGAVVRERPDIIHAHGRIPAFICRLLKDRRDFPPVVTTAHGFWDPMPPKGPLTYWGDRVISVSPALGEWLCEKYRLDPGRITVIGNGVEIPPASDRAASGRVRVCAACRLDPDNSGAVVMLAKELASLSVTMTGGGIRLTVAGEGSDRKRLENEVKIIAEGAGPGFGVSFTGALADLSGLLAESDIFVGASRSALEAAAAGLPVVTLSGGGKCGGILSPEISDELERTNLIPSGDKPEGSGSELLRSSLALLTGDKDLRAELGAYARSFAEKGHDIRSVAAETACVYREVISEKKGRVMLCGYFGARNAGDDATLDHSIEELREAGVPAGKISVICPKKGFSDIEKTGCRPVGRLDIRRIREELKKTRLFILCGGSLLQDLTSRRSLLYYTSMQRAAKKSGCLTAITGGGIGPLGRKNSEKAASAVLASVTHAGLRDRSSLAVAERLAGEARRRSGLPGFALSADAAAVSGSVTEPREDFGEKYGDYFVIAARDLPSPRRSERQRFLAALAAASAALRAGTGLRPVTAAMAPEDEEISRKLAAGCGGEYAGRMTPEEMKALLAGASLSVCVRLHAAVFSLSVLTPAVAVVYDPKVAAFAEQAGFPALDPGELSESSLLSAAGRLPAEEKMRETSERLAARRRSDSDAVARLVDP